MALPPLASVTDLSEWMGVDIDAGQDVVRAGAILNAASTLVRKFSGRMWIDAAGEPEEDLSVTELEAAKTVTTTVAERVYRNPAGITQETTGPFSRTLAEWAALGLKMTPEEEQMISLPRSGIPGLTSVRVVAPAEASGTRRQWCP